MFGVFFLIRSRGKLYILYKHTFVLFDAGILCGKCNNGSGFSALLNRCVTCGDSLALFIPFLGNQCRYRLSCPNILVISALSHLIPLAIVDVVLLVLIIALINRPFPDWLYPCLFFVQVNDKQLAKEIIVGGTVFTVIYFLLQFSSFRLPRNPFHLALKLFAVM